MRLYRNRQGLTKGKNKQPKKITAAQKKAAANKDKQAAKQKKKAKLAAEKNRKGSETPDKTRPELMAEMIAMVAAWFPDRRFMLVVDSLYSGQSVLRTLPGNFDMIGPVYAKAALYAPAPVSTLVKRGPRRKKGGKSSQASQTC
jgi:hypothetical protein